RSCFDGAGARLVSQRIMYFLLGGDRLLVLEGEEEEEPVEEEGERGEEMMVPLKEGQVRWSMLPATALPVGEEADGAEEEEDVGELELLLALSEDVDVLVGEAAGQAAAVNPPVDEFLLLDCCFNPSPKPAPSPTPKPIVIASKTRNTTNIERFKPHILICPSAGDSFSTLWPNIPGATGAKPLFFTPLTSTYSWASSSSGEWWDSGTAGRMAETASQGARDWVAADMMVADLDLLIKSWFISELLSVKAETAGVVGAAICGLLLAYGLLELR
ncbi:hypothetical protein N0V85_003711, partial [Neurospora sp. IMI 360204]